MDENKIKEIITGKRVLVVDDEKDVLDTLIDLLSMCKLDTARSFDEGKELLESNAYDIAILDIMGVKGFELLEVAKAQKIPALMLTAHALSEESLNRSVKEGAAYFAPKDEINNIDAFVADVLDAAQKNKSPWIRFMERLGGFYDRRFQGTDWREKELEFLKKITNQSL